MGIVDKASGGIYVKRGADNNQDIGLAHLFGRRGNHRHSFLKEDNVGPKQGPVGSLGAGSHLAVVGAEGLPIARILDIAAGAYLAEFAVQVNDVGGAGAFMQVINILRDDHHVVVLFHGSHQFMAAAGLGVE